MSDFSNISHVPQPTKYLFIDGGYLNKLCEEYSKKYFHNRKIELNFKELSKEYFKTFYYDCLPPRKSKEKKEDYEVRTAEKQQFFNELRMIDGFHVFEGYTRGEGKKNRQKGVDVSIAVDMLMHTYRKNMERATLIAGDLDFRPLLNELVREGMFVTLWHGRSASKELIYSADSHQIFDINTIHSFVKDRNNFKIPAHSIFSELELKNSDRFEILKSGKMQNGENVWLYKRHSYEGIYIVQDLQGGSDIHDAYHFTEENILVTYFNEIVGEFEWDE